MNLAELHRRVCFGESNGRIIWQPRIGCWFVDKAFAGETLPPPFERYGLPPGFRDFTPEDLNRAFMDLIDEALPAIYRELRCSPRIYYYNQCFRRIEDPAVRTTISRPNRMDTETRVETPVGVLTTVVRRLESSYASLHVKRPVVTEADMKVATWLNERATWAWDQDAFDELRGIWGDLGAPTMYMPRMNVQDLYVNAMGTEKGIYALYDWPVAVDAYFRSLEVCHDRLIDVINASPIDIVNFGDNVHAGTLSPELFLKYYLPECRRRCERLHRAGKFISAHWDGDTKPLLPYAADTGLDGIEAITPEPQGDVTLDEIKAGLGDRLFLLDGIPAILFDRTFSVSMLEDCAHRLIELFAPRLILGISDEISSTGDIDRIRRVGEIVEKHNARFSG